MAARELPVIDGVVYDPKAHGARCDICPLKKNVIVPPKKSTLETRVLFVGEAPGRKEEIYGTPFIGQTGTFLRSVCREVDLDIRHAHLSNAALCLDHMTLVRMADGSTKRIGWLVKNRCADEVLTVEKDGTIGHRPITGWYRNPLGGRTLLHVSHEWAKNNSNGAVRTVVTEDHPVMTRTGWVQARDLNGEHEIATGSFAPAGAALDVAYGTLLGDGHIPANRGAVLGFSHAEDQKEYALLKARVLQAKTRLEPGRNGWQPKVRAATYASDFWRKTRAEFYDGRQKRIPRHVLDGASDLLVAVWFMDNGYARSKPSARKPGSRSGVATPDGAVSANAEICAAGFIREDVAYAAASLRARGFDCKITPPGKPTRIIFSAAGARELSRRIARFVPPAMQYKLCPEDRGQFDESAYGSTALVPFYAKPIVRKASPRPEKTVYCIDVAETHNFITTAAVVHNCRSNLDKENDEAAVCCAPRLLKELAAFDKKIPIVTFGKTSTLSVLGVRSIMQARGFVWTAREIDASKVWKEAKKAKARGAPKAKQLWLKAQIAEGRSKLAGRTVLPTVHPAFVLRSDTWQPILKIDLDRIARWLSGKLKKKHLLENGRYTVVTKRDDVRREFKKLSDVIAVDIETGASKPGGSDGANPNRNRMLCVGISDGKHTIVVWPWRTKTHAPLLNALFKRVKTIGMHNGYNFDQIALARHGVPFEPLEDKLEDTLIAHHCFASHMPQRLSHVASAFVDAGPWKVTFKKGTDGASEKGLPPEKLPPEELCKYNAADARIQAQVWLAMQADLKDERHVYTVAKENARLCRGMAIDGIAVDLTRRAELRAAIVQKEEALLAEMRAILKRPAFHPMQLNEVRRALFTTLRAPMSIADPTESGMPSTSAATLERLKSSPTRAGKFADRLLQWRGAVKIRGTYIDSQVLDEPAKKTPTISRTHFNWRSYGAGSGRYSCRLQSCPRAEYLLDKSIVLETRVREVYVAKPGYKLVYFDLSQAEMRCAAYNSGDANFMKTCEGDVHSGNAKILFPTHAELIALEPKGRGKPFRDVAKNAGFGVTYLAENETVFQFLRSKGFDVHFKDVAIMMDHMHDAYAEYFRYVNRNVQTVSQTGHMRSVLAGRIRWLGWHCPPTEVANFPIQSMIADLMNDRLPKINEKAQKIGAVLVAQVHDAAFFETPVKKVDEMKQIIADAWKVPVSVPAGGVYGGSLKPEEGGRSFVMPIDLKVAERWSEL